jgi:hypothetical protein
LGSTGAKPLWIRRNASSTQVQPVGIPTRLYRYIPLDQTVRVMRARRVQQIKVLIWQVVQTSPQRRRIFCTAQTVSGIQSFVGAPRIVKDSE